MGFLRMRTGRLFFAFFLTFGLCLGETRASCEDSPGKRILGMLEGMSEPSFGWKNYDKLRDDRATPFILMIVEKDSAYLWSPMESLITDPLKTTQLEGLTACSDAIYQLDRVDYVPTQFFASFTEAAPPVAGRLAEFFKASHQVDLGVYYLDATKNEFQATFFLAFNLFKFAYLKRTEFYKNHPVNFTMDPISGAPACLGEPANQNLRDRIKNAEQRFRDLMATRADKKLAEIKAEIKSILAARAGTDLTEAQMTCLAQFEMSELLMGLPFYPAFNGAIKKISSGYATNLFAGQTNPMPAYSGVVLVYFLKHMASFDKTQPKEAPFCERKLEEKPASGNILLTTTPASLMRNSLVEYGTFGGEGP